MIKWNFPSNQAGQIKGIADAGIENFNGTELISLAREICQNSLDAAIDTERPNVSVEFERYLIANDQIPGVSEYKQILKNCKEFWERSHSERAVRFLSTAISQMNKRDSFVLRISDFNTTGLASPYSNINDFNMFCFDGWNALVKIDGGANKGDDKAGAFGIGKNAPFCNSYYRLVFYRTLNQKKERASQGVSRLMSFQEKNEGRNRGTITTNGIGYYGNTDGNAPVKEIPELERICTRSKTGTDVFVYGFNATSDWESSIIAAILESFLMSIFNGQLQVKIQGQRLDKATLGAHIQRIYAERPGEAKGTYGNYLALTENEKVHNFTRDFHGLGTLELKLLVDPSKKLDRKVLIVRKAGMKLFRLSNISRIISFTGVLELKGKSINSFFRKMETVAHDNWEPGRHDDPKLAKKYYEEIKDWIRDLVSELAEHTATDEMDIEGLSNVLRNDIDDKGDRESDNKHESLNEHLGQIDIVERPVRAFTKGFFYGDGDEQGKQKESTSGKVLATGDSAVRLLKGNRKRKK